MCTYVKSSRSQKLEVLSAEFPNSFPTPRNTMKSELVLTCFESLGQFGLNVDFCIFFDHRFVARVGLTPYCIHTWVGRQGPEHQSDMPAHQNLSCNCDNFHFFQSCMPFLRAKTTLFGLKIFRARDPVCARM